MENQFNRAIVHMDLDTFFVSVERLKDSSLNGKPILIGGKSDRGVVASCSYEARKFGVHSAMPMRTARQLCPEAIIVRGDSDSYTRYSNLVTDVIKEQAPAYEKSSIDEFYLDLSGMDKLFGCYKWSKELRHTIRRETGLPISFGLSTNKTVSKVATGEAKPDGQRQVLTGYEKRFLAPLSIKKIPMVGPKTYHLLRSMGVERIATLQEMPLELLQNVLGKHGISIWKKAQGVDSSPIIPYSEKKSISLERTMDKDSIDVRFLQALIISMTEKLAFKLRDSQKLTACVTVKIRYSDFDTHTLQRRISYTSSDHTLINLVKDLFKKAYARRMRVRLVGVKFSHLVHGAYQIDLFDDTEKQIHLYQAMDKINHRYGAQKVRRAVGMGIKHRDFNPFNGIR